MTLIEDTRQKIDQHDIKHTYFKQAEIELIRCALPFGDYCKPPTISVDTKQEMGEIASNLTADHERFRHECEKAQQAGCHLYILIETEWNIRDIDDVHIWVNPRRHFSVKAVTGKTLERIMKTMSHRYGVTFMFCRPSESGEMIMRILDGEFENE
jgi:ribosome-associated protein